MEAKALAKKIANERLSILRNLGRNVITSRTKASDGSLPTINVTIVVPPEAIKVVVAQKPAQVTVNVPQQKAPTVHVQPKFEVQAPSVTVEPKIEIKVPDPPAQKPKRATIKHADGSESTVELK